MPKRLFVPILRLLRLNKAIRDFAFFAHEERRRLALVLAAGSPDRATPELKLKIYEAILLLRARIKRPFGLFIVLGWRREWSDRYVVIQDATQDIFQNKHVHLQKLSLSETARIIRQTIDFDGAILICRDGTILHGGVYLENLKPKEVAHFLHPGRAEDMSSAFGFAKKVHARHIAAITASYVLRHSTVFVLSEEDRSARILEGGRIVWSTVREEIRRINTQ